MKCSEYFRVLGIGLQISVSMKALAIGVSFPTIFRNSTKGLLGNFNGDNTDDFVLPGGQVLRNNLTEKEILIMFCLQCKQCIANYCSITYSLIQPINSTKDMFNIIRIIIL